MLAWSCACLDSEGPPVLTMGSSTVKSLQFHVLYPYLVEIRVLVTLGSLFFYGGGFLR